jgi:anti-anti-sigma regulatory factor
MTTVHYEAGTHRLRLEGPCRDADRSALHEALDTFAPMAGGHLIVDLTGVTSMDQRVANDLVAAARSANKEHEAFTIVRKHGTVVDEALIAAEAGSTS